MRASSAGAASMARSGRPGASEREIPRRESSERAFSKDCQWEVREEACDVDDSFSYIGFRSREVFQERYGLVEGEPCAGVRRQFSVRHGRRREAGIEEGDVRRP